MLDIVGIIIVFISFIRGYMKGFIIAVFSFVGIILGILCALKLSHAFAEYLFDKGIVTSAWAQVVSYVALFIGVLLLVGWVGKALESVLKALMLGTINKLLGGLVYACIGAIVWSCLLWLGNQMHLFSPETIAYSKTYQWFMPLAPWVFAHIGHMLPMAKNLFGDLQHFFDNVNQKLPQHVGAHR